MNELKQLKDCGFSIEGSKKVLNYKMLAQDSNLMITTNNFGIPQEFSTFLDPVVIDIIQAPQNSKLCYSEIKKGDHTSTIEKFRINDLVGHTQAYSDFSNQGTVNTNYNWEFRENYLFETIIQYGDLETEVSSLAKINLASDKQRSAATIIEQDSNRFNVYGVANKIIYGMINDPNLNNAIVPTQGTSGSALWANKTANEIYKDFLNLFAKLQAQLNGHARMTDKIDIILPSEQEVYLLNTNDLGISVIAMLKSAFPNMNTILMPEYKTTAGNLIQMKIDDIISQPTGQLGFSEKFIGGRIIPELSSFKQKFKAGTYGFIGFRTAAIAQMLGI